MSSHKDFTDLLLDLKAGKTGAGDAILPLVYDELHALAERYMRSERRGHTLQTTALVHEAYIRLGGEKDASFENRAHFFRLAAQAMRRVLIDYARRRQTGKGEGGMTRKVLDDVAIYIDGPLEKLIDLDEALCKLSKKDPQASQVVELRYFGGLSLDETGRVLGVSTWTVKRDWRVAKAWLKQKISESDNDLL